MQQILAVFRGDLDRVIALESEKPERLQNRLDMAERLLGAGRPKEALDWMRGPGQASSQAMEARLEARILEALDRETEARALRWRVFSETLSPELLRDHLASLPDFEDIEAEERAMAVAMDHTDEMRALALFLERARTDLAATLILRRATDWDGGDWHVLPDVAEPLEHDHPAAATILYRALLQDILQKERSKAYSHGARYLAKLDLFADAADPDLPAHMPSHATFRGSLYRDHARKRGFWGRERTT